jgi:hypothetical protein
MWTTQSSQENGRLETETFSRESNKRVNQATQSLNKKILQQEISKNEHI